MSLLGCCRIVEMPDYTDDYPFVPLAWWPIALMGRCTKLPVARLPGCPSTLMPFAQMPD